MDNPEEVLHSLDEFAKLKPKNIPRELEDYLMYVARTGDPVYQWPTVKILFREKLLSVITEFYENTPTLELAPSPNVDPFNYESMKTVLLDRLEAFSNAPFTVQRLCELLTTPRKEYNRPDKFMRAIEKNILVVSTREPGSACRPDSALSEPIHNGVSESSETTNNQSSSSGSDTIETSTEEIPAETSSSTSEKEDDEKCENHVASESVTEESNHQVAEQPEVSAKISEEAEVSKKEEEPSESTIDNVEERMVATEPSDSTTFEEVKSVPEESDTINVTSTDCVSNSDMKDAPAEPIVCVAETSEVESVPSLSSSSDVKINVDEVLETVQESSTTEPVKNDVIEAENETENKSESTESEDPSSSPSLDVDQASSEAVPAPSETSEEPSKLSEGEAPVEEESTGCVLAVSSVSSESEQTADSTASEPVTEQVSPSSDVVSSGTPDDVPTDIVTDSKAEEKDALPDNSEAREESEAAQVLKVLKKGESEAKPKVEAVKGNNGSITRTEATSTGGADEEAMEVDESSNGEAMDTAEEDEAMEVCDENALEEMTTSPQEPPQ